MRRPRGSPRVSSSWCWTRPKRSPSSGRSREVLEFPSKAGDRGRSDGAGPAAPGQGAIHRALLTAGQDRVRHGRRDALAGPLLGHRRGDVVDADAAGGGRRRPGWLVLRHRARRARAARSVRRPGRPATDRHHRVRLSRGRRGTAGLLDRTASTRVRGAGVSAATAGDAHAAIVTSPLPHTNAPSPAANAPPTSATTHAKPAIKSVFVSRSSTARSERPTRTVPRAAPPS